MLGAAWFAERAAQAIEVEGPVSITRSGRMLHLRQNTAQALLQWSSFDVAADETTLIEFDGPAGSNSTLLIQITGGQPSAIAGSIRSVVGPGGKVGGAVRLQNSHGILFSPSARVEAGSISLLGGDIQNLGSIVSENGPIILRSGGGTVCNAGSLSARKADGSGGTIILDCGHNAAGTATVSCTGLIEAQGLRDGALGGTVELIGDQVGLFEQGLVDVRGPGGGGRVLMGGDCRGANPEIKNARAAYMGPAAGIKADGLAAGDGGKVIVWSDNSTRCYGSISVRGGAQGGGGGFAEVSGHHLDFQGKVTSLAPHGAVGSLLLDPTDLTISNVNQNINSNTPFIPTGSPSQLSWAAINAALASGAVTVTTSGSPNTGGSGNITITAASPAMNSANNLSISALGLLTINSGCAIVNNGGGDLQLQGFTGVAINANVTNTGLLTVKGAATLGNDVTLTGSSVTFNSTVDGPHALVVSGSAALGGEVGGNQALASLTLENAASLTGFVINTTGSQTYNGPVTLGQSTTLTSTGSGNITLAGTVDEAYDLVVNTAGTTTFGGAVGNGAALTSITTGAPGTTAINGGGVTTTGAQTYYGPVTLGTATTLNSGTVELGTVNSPANASLTLNNHGLAALNGAMTGVSSLTARGTGTVQVNSTISPASVTVASGATLAGNGTINAPVLVQAGGTLSPGASLGALTISNTLTLSGTAFLQLDMAVPTNSFVRGLSNIAYNSTLTVTNLAGTLAMGDRFFLFEAAAYGGAFGLMNLPALGGGLAWSTASLGSNGSIAVVSSQSSVTISNYGFNAGQFHFYLSGPVGQNVVVQASTNLPVWLPVWSNAFGTAGPLYFSDPQSSLYAHRLYRAVSP